MLGGGREDIIPFFFIRCAMGAKRCPFWTGGGISSPFFSIRCAMGTKRCPFWCPKWTSAPRHWSRRLPRRGPQAPRPIPRRRVSKMYDKHYSFSISPYLLRFNRGKDRMWQQGDSTKKFETGTFCVIFKRKGRFSTTRAIGRGFVLFGIYNILIVSTFKSKIVKLSLV